jgi:hypothetical protein
VSDDGVVYGGFIEAEAGLERERRAEIDRRGTAVVTSSGAFVTLALALSAVLIGRGALLVPTARPIFLAAVAVLVIACLSAVLATLNLTYEVADVSTLRAMTEEHWQDTTADARFAVTHLQILAIARLRKANSTKANLLRAGLSAQAVAVLLLGAAIAVQVTDS